MNNRIGNNKIILFDGVCNFCNYWVNFILDRDENDQFKFASLQSLKGQELLTNFNLPKDDFDSFILINNGKVFEKSKAALNIAKDLGGILIIFYPLVLFPASLLDFFYDLIAKNRYRLFGKREYCRIPTDNEKQKFL